MKTAATADGICSFIDASPSPFHVCESVAKVLDDNGFSPLDETQPWQAGGRHYVIRGGSIIAWDDSRSPGQVGGRSLSRAFRIVGGHTDSPNLRLKQHPDGRFGDMRMVALEPYGGAWLNSWLDRDLGLSGRISVTNGNVLEHKLVQIQAPILRVPQLAIHLSEDRKAVKLDPQRHVNAILGIGDGPTIFELVAATTGCDPRKIVGWELMTHDLTPSRLLGIDQELVSAPRLDNQGTCYAGLHAFVAALGDQQYVPVLSLFDHEEVGSGSDRGAASNFLSTVLERIILARGGSRDDYLQAMAASACASGDMAHATHPNYPDRHEPSHEIWINGGPVLKVNQNLRYASDADGEGLFALAAEQAGVPLQRYVHRADLPCGSTIGPITATRTGLTTVDVGAPQLAMHSAREMMGAADVGMYASALTAFLQPQ